MARHQRRHPSLHCPRIPLLHSQERSVGSWLERLRHLSHPPYARRNLLRRRTGHHQSTRRRRCRHRHRPQLHFRGISERCRPRPGSTSASTWIMSKEEFERSLTREQLIRELEASRRSVFARPGTSRSHPVRVPSLIGLQDIKYLDATGLVRHRSIGDIMRYAIINEGLDTLAYYGDFQPSPTRNCHLQRRSRAPAPQRRATLRPRPLYLLAQTSRLAPTPSTIRRAATASKSSRRRVAPHATPWPSTPTTCSTPPRASKFRTISATPTSCPSP